MGDVMPRPGQGLPATRPTGEQTALRRETDPGRAVQYHHNCGPEVLLVEDADEPELPARHAADHVGGLRPSGRVPTSFTSSRIGRVYRMGRFSTLSESEYTREL